MTNHLRAAHAHRTRAHTSAQLTQLVGKVSGFSLHAGVVVEAHESQELERLCRYIAHSAIPEERLSISPEGRVWYRLKTPWRNGTTHMEWNSVNFIAKLAPLVPPPRAHLTRFHGVIAPNAALRAQLTPWCVLVHLIVVGRRDPQSVLARRLLGR